MIDQDKTKDQLLEEVQRLRQRVAVFEQGDNLEARVRERTAQLQQTIQKLRAEVARRERAEAALRQSDMRFRLFMENTPAAVWVKDEEGRYVYVNQLQERLFQRTFLGRTDFELWSEATARRLCEHDAAVLASGNPQEVMETVPLPDGSASHWLVFKFPFHEAAGKRLLAGVAIDVTAHKLAEERVKQQAALLDQANDAILLCDLAERILYWNQGAQRLFGWTAAEAAGQAADELLWPGPPPELAKARQAILDKGEWQGELAAQTKEGKPIVVASRWNLVLDENGQPRSKLVINTDITQQKILATQYLRAQRLESLGTLAGGIAHDLNNVLAPIMMTVDLLQMQFTDPELPPLLDPLKTSIQRGADLVKQVLTFARGVEGQRQELQLQPLTKELVKLLQQTFPKSITIQAALPRDLWLVAADSTQVHQVLMNLCVNARDAMPMGGRITITARNQLLDENEARANPEAKPGPYVVLSVEDTGTGIPPTILDKIFDPFFTTKEVGIGTGLGLSTVLGIVKVHGGFMRVDSEVGKGSRFVVYFPALVSATTIPTAKKIGELPSGQGELVLVVDDEAAICQITKGILEAAGYQVVTAQDGAQALTHYGQHQDAVRLVLIDFLMPVMDGVATIEALRKLNPHVPIIAASGFGERNISPDAISGVQAFLAKPFTAQTLLETVHQTLAAR